MLNTISKNIIETFSYAYEEIKNGNLKTFIPFLCLFHINGKPMNLKLHYQFAPLFNTVQAPHTVVMTGRQVGKTHTICADSALRSGLIPFYHTLIIQPRADQIQRLNATVYQPILRSCPIQNAFITNVELSKLALKTFNNGSLCYLEHMFTSADRVRGVSGAATCLFDEVQDIEYDYLAIANETMSASLFWGFSRYTGTPKTTDTTLALLWDRSSQAEWVIRCEHCNYYNVPNPEHDLLKMLGKDYPICAKCGSRIYPQNGGYVHAIPERMLSFPGYHISQTTHPLHVSSHSKWLKLLDKVNSYTQLTLYNEVFGWPYDAATSPLVLHDLLDATHDIKDIAKPTDVIKYRDIYRYITVGVDWSGGGMISDSYTVYAVLGLRKNSDTIDVLYAKRIPKGVSPTDEAKEILHWIKGTNADAYAFDNGGAGFTRLEIMNQQGLRETGVTVVPINYVRPKSGDIMSLHKAIRESDLYYYTLDKSRSLSVCIMAIKSKKIRFKPFSADDPDALPKDFLALREDPRESAGSNVVILIIKKPGVPDDFAHAVNFGCSQIWDHFGAYPKIGTKYDTTYLDYDENNHKIMDDEVFGPRGDFERFADAVAYKADVIEPDYFF